MEGFWGGGFGVVQFVFFVFNFGNVDEYYFFIMEEWEFVSDGLFVGQLQGCGFMYFLFNCIFNGGFGGIVFEDDWLYVFSFEFLSGILYGNGIDFWVIIVDDNIGDFFNYCVMFIEVFGLILEEWDVIDFLVGLIKIFLVCNWLFVGGVLYNFNVNNGNIFIFWILFGVVNFISYFFFFNGNYLYVMEFIVSGLLLVCYELFNFSFLFLRIIIGLGLNECLGVMQFVLDGCIYLVFYDEDVFQVIYLYVINCFNLE